MCLLDKSAIIEGILSSTPKRIDSILMSENDGRTACQFDERLQPNFQKIYQNLQNLPESTLQPVGITA
jgi:hypothetical protein